MYKSFDSIIWLQSLIIEARERSDDENVSLLERFLALVYYRVTYDGHVVRGVQEVGQVQKELEVRDQVDEPPTTFIQPITSSNLA